MSAYVVTPTAAARDTYIHMRADNCDNPDALVDYDDDGGDGTLSKLEFLHCLQAFTMSL